MPLNTLNGISIELVAKDCDITMKQPLKMSLQNLFCLWIVDITAYHKQSKSQLSNSVSFWFQPWLPRRPWTPCIPCTCSMPCPPCTPFHQTAAAVPAGHLSVVSSVAVLGIVMVFSMATRGFGNFVSTSDGFSPIPRSMDGEASTIRGMAKSPVPRSGQLRWCLFWEALTEDGDTKGW